jgi:periplasmic copper chaperone A
VRTRDLTSPPARRRRGWWPVAAALSAGALVMAGCGAEAPMETPRGEVAGGAIGPDERVSEDITVLAVQFEHPVDGVYEEGEDARLRLAISNTGTEPDVLIDVTGPDFADARTSRAGGDGPVDLQVPAGDNVYVGAEGPSLTILDLGRSLRSSQSIPVTFTFQRAGTVTMQVMVAAESRT